MYIKKCIELEELNHKNRNSYSIHIFFSLKDPEALAQLMKNMPLTNDGKFLLLEPETGDTTNPDGQEDSESEA